MIFIRFDRATCKDHVALFVNASVMASQIDLFAVSIALVMDKFCYYELVWQAESIVACFPEKVLAQAGDEVSI